MNKKILLVCPTYDAKVSAELIKFIYEAGKSDYEVIPHPIIKKPTDVARNLAVSMAQNMAAHLIFFDADAVPAKGTFNAIAEKISQEECVAAVPYMSAGNQICVGERSPNIKDVEHLEGWQQVENVGTHVCGYSAGIFRKIPRPYFAYHYNTDHTAIAGYAEDTVCHRKFRECKVPIYVNWSLWAQHLIVKAVDKPKTLTPLEAQLAFAGVMNG